MTAKEAVFWTLVAIGGIWALVMLVAGTLELWRTRGHRAWWRDQPEGDFLDLRPHYIGRRRWR